MGGRASRALRDPAGGEQQGLLARLSVEVARVHKEHYGRGPDRVRSYVLDDLLLIVLRGGVTVAEKTMLAAGRQDEVRAFRQSFEREIAGTLRALVEDLSGRRVVRCESQVVFDPDIVFEIFVFDDRA